MKHHNQLRMTASTLKHWHEYHNPDSLFFSRDSMKFAGDTMSNFYVPAGVVEVETFTGDKYTCYELVRRHRTSKGMPPTTFYFDTETFKRIHIKQ